MLGSTDQSVLPVVDGACHNRLRLQLRHPDRGTHSSRARELAVRAGDQRTNSRTLVSPDEDAL
jgi:hypothetical protein